MVSESRSLRRLVSDTYTSFAPIFCPKRRLVEPLVTVLLMLACGAIGLQAQTAHFSGVQTRIGIGFSQPRGVAVDGGGNVFVADWNNNAVEEIRVSDGATITLGSGFKNPAGVAVDSTGDVFVADMSNSCIKEMLAVNGVIPTSPTIRTLWSGLILPDAVAVDSLGDVYFSDFYNSSVNEILAVNGSIPNTPTVVTLGSGFSRPDGVAVDASGNVYVGDTSNSAVKEMLAVNGSIPSSPTIVTLGSGFSGPSQVTLDTQGDLFVADSGNGAIKEMVAINGVIPANPAIVTIGSGYSQPIGVGVDVNGNVFIADTGNLRVLKDSLSLVDFGSQNAKSSSLPISLNFTFDTNGTLGSIAVVTQGASGLDFEDAGTGTCAANTAYTAGQTCTVNATFSPRYPGTQYGAALLKDASGSVLATANLQGTGVASQLSFVPGTQSIVGSGFEQPWGVAVDAAGNVFVADTYHLSVKQLLAVNGSIPASPTINVLGSVPISVEGVAVDGSGNVYVADFPDNKVFELTKASGYASEISLGGGFYVPSDVAVDGNGNVIVADYGNNAVKKIPPGCLASSCVVTLGSGFNSPFSVALDGRGDIFVGDTNNFAIKEILASSGYTTTKTLRSNVYYAEGLAVDSNGDVFFTDLHDSEVQEITAADDYATVRTIATGFTDLFHLALSPSGKLFIADTINNRIVQIDLADPPSLSFATTLIGSTSTDSPQTVTIENTGNAFIEFPTDAIGQTNPSISANFTLDDNAPSACPQSTYPDQWPTLNPGQSCALSISFAPTSIGSISGSVILTDNNLNAGAGGNASQSIALSGTATLPAPFIISAGPSSIQTGQGSSINTTVSVSGSSVNSVITLSASNLPTGVTVYFNPPLLPVPGNGSSAMTLTVGSTVVPGTYAISITGTGGGATQSTSVSLTVQPSANGLSAHFSGAQSTVPTRSFTYLDGVAVDGSGNLYIADGYSNLVVKETATETGYTESVLPATGLNVPSGLAVDANGSVYIVDEGNNRVLKETPSGGSYTQSVVASGLSNPGDIAVDASGNVYISDSNSHGAYKETLSGGTYIQSRLASGLIAPSGIAVDNAGNVYIADFDAKQILLETPSGSGYTQSVLPISGLLEPGGLALDASGNLYIASYGTNQVLMETPAGSSYAQSIIGSGLSEPRYVAVDANGNIFVSDSGNRRVLEESLTGPNFRTVNVGSMSTAATLSFTIDTPGTLGSTAVLTQGATGLDFKDAGGGTCTANTAYSAGQTCTVNVAFAPKASWIRTGAVELNDTNGNEIATANLQGTGIGPQVNFSPGEQTTLGNSFSFAKDVAIDGSGNAYVVDIINNLGNVQEIMAVNGKIPPNPAIRTLVSGLDCPAGPAVDAAGDVFFADVCFHTLNEIQAVNGVIPSSPTIRTLTTQFAGPFSMKVDRFGNLYVADGSNNTVNEIRAVNGSIPASPTITTLASGFKELSGMAVDSNGNVYVSDDASRQVFEIHATNGSIPASPTITSLGSGFVIPRGIAVDSLGNVYVAEYFYNTVYKILAVNGSIPASPTIQNLGSGLVYANGVALDGKGNVFVADYGDARLVELDYADPPSLSFASTPAGSTSTDSPQSVTVENIGNAALTLPIPSSGNNPSISPNFTLDGNAPNACPIVSSGSSAGTLAAGASCALSISFAPTSVGAIGGSLILTDNNLNAVAPGYAQQNITLSGTGLAAPAVLTSPVPESTLPGSSTTFTWTAGSGVTYYSLWVGSQGVGSHDIAVIGATKSLSGTVSGLPTNGETLFVRMLSYINGAWQFTDYTYTANGTPVLSALTSPTPGTQLTGSSTTFTWTAGSGVTYYSLWIGSHVGTHDVGLIPTTTALSGTVTGLPNNGETLYVRMLSYINGAWQFTDYTYTAF